MLREILKNENIQKKIDSIDNYLLKEKLYKIMNIYYSKFNFQKGTFQKYLNYLDQMNRKTIDTTISTILDKNSNIINEKLRIQVQEKKEMNLKIKMKKYMKNR